MRNALVVTLALSLAANVFFLTRPTNDASLDRRVPPEPPVQAEKPKPPADQPRIDISSLSPEVVASLREVDPTTLRDLLEACGASGPMVRAAVAGAIRQQHMAERHAIIMANRLPGWWQPYPDTDDLISLKRLDRKIADEEDRVIGHHPWPRPPWIEERYAFLSEEKKDALQRIEEDYDRMRIDLPRHHQRLPIDEARAELLETEYIKDVSALLSSDELTELDYRIRARIAGAELQHYPFTDEEFRQALAIIKTRDSALETAGLKHRSKDPFAPANPDDPADKIWDAAQDQIDALVGIERLRVAKRNQNLFFQKMLTLSEHLEIPRRRAEQSYDQAADLLNELDSSDLPPDLRETKIRQLRETIVSTLGVDAYHAFHDSYPHLWVKR